MSKSVTRGSGGWRGSSRRPLSGDWRACGGCKSKSNIRDKEESWQLALNVHMHVQETNIVLFRR